MQSIISIPRLRAALNGRVITPGDTGYDHARTVFHGGVVDQRRPAVIIRVADATDAAPIPEHANGKPIVMALLVLDGGDGACRGRQPGDGCRARGLGERVPG
jgi:hypothetical protein